MEKLSVADLDNAIKYHEMLLRMTKKRGCHPSAHEEFTLEALIYLKGLIENGKKVS